MADTFWLSGMQIVTSDVFTKGVIQRRKHKQRRVNKKWLKRYGKIPMPDSTAYVVGNICYMHPKIFEKLKRELGERSGGSEHRD